MLGLTGLGCPLQPSKLSWLQIKVVNRRESQTSSTAKLAGAQNVIVPGGMRGDILGRVPRCEEALWSL